MNYLFYYSTLYQDKTPSMSNILQYKLTLFVFTMYEQILCFQKFYLWNSISLFVHCVTFIRAFFIRYNSIDTNCICESVIRQIKMYILYKLSIDNNTIKIDFIVASKNLPLIFYSRWFSSTKRDGEEELREITEYWECIPK